MHDFGDIVRTCCSNLAEDDVSIEKMVLNIDIFQVLITNYQQAFGDKLSLLERESLLVGAKLLPFIMGTRFLTDYLNGDKSYTDNWIVIPIVEGSSPFSHPILFFKTSAFKLKASEKSPNIIRPF